MGEGGACSGQQQAEAPKQTHSCPGVGGEVREVRTMAYSKLQFQGRHHPPPVLSYNWALCAEMQRVAPS